MEWIKKNGLGIILCIVISAAATFLASLSIGSFSLEIIGAPVFAILFGMLISLAAPSLAGKDSLKHGIKFTSKKILQWAVIILGFSLDLNTILKVGGKSLPVIISTISISLITALVLMRVMKINKKVACLIGVGSSICGGSAIAATAPVIDADDDEVAQSISVIFLFNVIAALIFPALGHAIGLGSEGFAVFAGTAVNDTSAMSKATSGSDSKILNFARRGENLEIITKRFLMSEWPNPLTSSGCKSVDCLSIRMIYCLESKPRSSAARSAWYSCTSLSERLHIHTNGLHHSTAHSAAAQSRSQLCPDDTCPRSCAMISESRPRSPAGSSIQIR